MGTESRSFEEGRCGCGGIGIGTPLRSDAGLRRGLIGLRYAGSGRGGVPIQASCDLNLTSSRFCGS